MKKGAGGENQKNIQVSFSIRKRMMEVEYVFLGCTYTVSLSLQIICDCRSMIVCRIVKLSGMYFSV